MHSAHFLTATLLGRNSNTVSLKSMLKVKVIKSMLKVKVIDNFLHLPYIE